MEELLSRRQFVGISGGLLAGAAAATLLPGVARAAEAKLPLCLACRDSLLGVANQPDCWSALGSIGAEGVEATIGEDLSLPVLRHPQRKYSAATDAGIQELAADLKTAGRRITAFCMYNRFEERPDFEIEWCTKAARAAQALGVKAIRIDVVPRKLSAPEFLDLAVATLKKLMQAAEPTGVAFGIENHGGTTNNPDFLKPLFERVGSRLLGLTLDTGNFYWYGHPLSKLYEIYAAFAPRVFHTHLKSIRFPEDQRERQRPVGWEYGRYNCPIDQGDIDFRRVVKILTDAGYSNDLCVEDESLGKFPKDEQAAVLKKEIATLKRLA